MTQEMTMEEIRAYFAQDQFATDCLGAYIDSFELGGLAQVSMEVTERHLNAQGFVMGGVFMALCDFALAVCSNANQIPSCSVNHSIEMMNRCKGSRLIAKAHPVREGKTLSFYEVDLYDELGTHVARMAATCLKTPQVETPHASADRP